VATSQSGNAGARDASLTINVSGTPWDASCLATAPPTLPVEPVIAVVVIALSSSALVQNEVMTDVYKPGMCNIGAAEIAGRRRVGWIGLGITIVLLGFLLAFDAPWQWRLILFIPAAVSANGFLQAELHFCVRFGMKGLFNFGDDTTKHETVMEAEFRRKDQRMALTIILWSAMLAAILTAVTSFLP
jgi:hypothetical protein